MLTYLLGHFLLDYQRQKEESALNLEAAAYGNLLRAALDRELNSLLYLSNGLSSFIKVYRNELDKQKMQAILADLWSNARHVRNLAVAVNYRVTYIYPLHANEKVLGLDYRSLSAQWPKVKLAVDSRQGVLDGPLQLVQGGTGMIYRYPIFIEDQYWGILSTVIDTPSFLQSAFKQVPRTDFSFAIRTADQHQVFYGDAALFTRKNVFIQETLVPNGTWQWAISTAPDKAKASQGMGWMLSVVMSALVGVVAYFFAQERYYLSEGALMDSLTGLPNRRLFETRLSFAHAEAKRDRRRFGLMALDVDHFKSINDRYGHDVGDEVIKAVAARLKSNIRDLDTVSRMGGDEFVILIKDQQSEQGLIKVATKLLDIFSVPMLINEHHIPVHLSIGLAMFNPDSDVTLKQLLKQADLALYEAKHTGRNTFSLKR